VEMVGESFRQALSLFPAVLVWSSPLADPPRFVGSSHLQLSRAEPLPPEIPSFERVLPARAHVAHPVIRSSGGVPVYGLTRCARVTNATTLSAARAIGFFLT